MISSFLPRAALFPLCSILQIGLACPCRAQTGAAPSPYVADITKSVDYVSPATLHRRDLDRQAVEAEAIADKGDPDTTIGLLRKLIESEPVEAERAHQFLADLYAAKGDNAHALEQFHFMMYNDQHPHNDYGYSSDVPSLMKYAIVLHRTQQYAAAYFVFQRGLNRVAGPFGPSLQNRVNDQNMVSAQLPFIAQLAIVGEDAGHLSSEDAVVHAQAAVRMRPEAAIGHYYLGLALGTRAGYYKTMRPGDPDECRKEMRIAYDTGDEEVRKWVRRMHYINVDAIINNSP